MSATSSAAPEAPKKTTSFLTDVIAGSLGGIAGRMIEYPFDTLKVQLQTAYSGGERCRCASAVPVIFRR